MRENKSGGIKFSTDHNELIRKNYEVEKNLTVLMSLVKSSSFYFHNN